MAPLSHHLQDSTHTSFGVITTGLVFRPVQDGRLGVQWPRAGRAALRHPVRGARFLVGALERGRIAQLDGSIQLRKAGASRGVGARQPAPADGFSGICTAVANGSWATSLVWGRVHKELENRNLNGYLLETTANFQSRNYAFSRMELVDKDELFPGNPVLPSFRIGAYTFGGARDLVHNRLWQLALGADLTFYSKPAALDAAYGNRPISFQIFLRARPGVTDHRR
jgi:hypothetical protein